MAQLPEAVGVIKLQFKYTQSSTGPIMNRTFYHYSGAAPNVTELQTFVAGAHTEYTTHVLPQVSDMFFLDSVTGTDLSSTTSPEYEYSLVKGGTIGSAVLPPGEALCVNFKIARRYRGGHPRWYQGGIPAGNVDQNGSISPVYSTAFKTGFDAFLNAVPNHIWTGGGQCIHVSVSYYKGFTVHTKPGGRTENIPTPRPTPTVDQVVGTAVIPKICSQRRRNQVP